MIIDPTEDFIEKNFTKLQDFIETQVKDELTQKGLRNLVSSLGDRLALAPASTRSDYHSAFPGGLVYHTLHTLQWAGKFATTMAPGKYSNETLLTVVLLHNVGKVGDLENDYYLPLNSDWHNKRGIYYEFNPKCSGTPTSRSLFWAMNARLMLNHEEVQALTNADTSSQELDSGIKYHLPKLAHILRNADLWATILEKENEVRY